MAHQHVLDGVLLVERVVDVEDGTTRVTPDVFHTFGLQGADHDFGAHELFGGGGLCGGSCGQFGLVDFHDEPFENFSDEKPWVPLAEPL
jgi:hypothetical protein